MFTVKHTLWNSQVVKISGADLGGGGGGGGARSHCCCIYLFSLRTERMNE